jgi:hypothetical protein
VTKSEHNGVPWSDVAVQRSPGMYTVYKLTEVARGTPAELAAMSDPDAPKIEVVPVAGDNAEIVCGEWVWDNGWTRRETSGDVYSSSVAHEIATLLRKHKDYPDGGAQ